MYHPIGKMGLLRIPLSPLIFSTPGNVTSRPLQSPLWSFTSRTVNHDATLIHGSLDMRVFEQYTLQTQPKLSSPPLEGNSKGHTYLSIQIFRLQTFMGAGHFFPFFFLFLVLEGPLSEDTHSLDPAPDKSGGPPPEFFFSLTRWDSRHRCHVAESRLLPASQASLS